MLYNKKLLLPNISNEDYCFQSWYKLYAKKFCLAMKDISDRFRIYYEYRK
jgi:hypothetical protein